MRARCPACQVEVEILSPCSIFGQTTSKSPVAGGELGISLGFVGLVMTVLLGMWAFQFR